VHETQDPLGEADAYIIASLRNPQQIYDRLVEAVPSERVLSPKFLEIMKTGSSSRRRKK